MLFENISFNPIRNTPLVVVVIYGREPAHQVGFSQKSLSVHSYIQSTNSIDVDIAEGALSNCKGGL